MLARIALVFLLLAAPAAAFDGGYEAQNFAKVTERATYDYSAEDHAALLTMGLENQNLAGSILADDGPGRQYGRLFAGNLCANPMNGCAGDIRLYDFVTSGYGIAKPVLFTQRNGSTLSGHVWMTRKGPRKRPGVVITNGSVQAPETLYWFAAQTLAKAGYIVLTWDPQGQGLSDTFGEGPDRLDGFPSQEGRPFYDGTEDALDFFLSSPEDPYVPRPSCTSGTSHADKQQARVADGRASAYNPFFDRIKRKQIGLVGHSLGAAAVSYVGQLDPRVKTIVAYDNLRDVTQGGGPECASGSSQRPETLPVTKPALGLAGDYGLVPTPFTSQPDPLAKSTASLAASEAGVDTGQIVIRGGTHFEFSYIPLAAFTATLRGIDMVAWYTEAWLDLTLRGDRSAVTRLATKRWNDDPRNKEVDAAKDGNMFSAYHRSRLDLTTGFACEDLRAGCPGQPADDGRPSAPYSFLQAIRTPDAGPAPDGASTRPAGSTDTPPAATGDEAAAAIAAAACTARPVARIVRAGRRVVRGRTRSGCPGRAVRTRILIRRAGRPAKVRVRTGARWRVRVPKGGRYRVRVQATDAAGTRSAVRRTRFPRGR